MRLIFFSKYSKFNVDFSEAIKMEKKFLVLEISAFELVAVNLQILTKIELNGSHCVNELS